MGSAAEQKKAPGAPAAVAGGAPAEPKPRAGKSDGNRPAGGSPPERSLPGGRPPGGNGAARAAGATPSTGNGGAKAAGRKAAGPVAPNAPRPNGAKPRPAPQPDPDDAAAKAQAQREQAEKATAAVRAQRRRRARGLALRLTLGVVLPTTLAGVYQGFVATKQYESVSLFTVDSTDAGSGSSSGLLRALVAIPAVRDTLAVHDYILSRDMLARLDREHKFIAHYSDPNADWWSRFTGTSFEDAYKFYDDQVLLHIDSTSGVVELTVRAFSAEKAREFSEAILAYAEERVNQMSERARKDQMEFAQKEVDDAKARLLKARNALLELQQERGEIDPAAAAQAAMTIRTGLEAELAKARAELMELRAYMRPDAIKVVAAEERVRSLAAQVAGESTRLVSPSTGKGLSASIAKFEGAAVEKEFAEQMFQSALASLEMARADATRQHRYLSVVAAPNQADESTYPRVWYGIVTVLLGSVLALGVGSLGLAAIKEHARV